MRTLKSVAKSYFYEVSSNHCRLIKSGIISYVHIGNRTITRYAQCGHLCLARQMFDEMPHRDTVSWNTLITGYVNLGRHAIAWDLFNWMRRCHFVPDKYSFGSLLKSVAFKGDICKGEQLHCLVYKAGFLSDVVTGSSLLDMYAKCRRVDDAYMVFQMMPQRNTVSWNAMIAGFVDKDDFDTAFMLLDGMEKAGEGLQDGTVAPFLTMLNDPKYLRLTVQLHGKIIKNGLAFNNVVCNALLTAYAECMSLDDAEKVFNGSVGAHDSVTWNSLLAAYLLHHKERRVFELFLDMKNHGFEPDIYTYTSVISACFEVSCQNHGVCFHCLIIKTGLEGSTAIANALIAMYVKCDGKSMVNALRMFHLIHQKDSVSWNSVLTGFSQYGMSEDAVKFFGGMRSHDVGIDHYSFTGTLRSCADLAAIELGRQVHALALMSGLQSNVHVAGSLVFMYSKCGFLDDARRSFEETPKDSPITWNFIIFGYAQHGQGKVALELFHKMTKSKVKLDHVTFVAVLTACSHMGWVDQGRHIIKTMESEYGIPLRMEHYACAIDLFGRAGLLNEVKSLLESMPFKPDVMLLKTLLGACRSCGDVELANQVAKRLVEIAPEEHCSYVIMSDMYGRLKRWEDKASLTMLMRQKGVKKVPGWSWIEINHEAHSFNAEDSSHPNCKEIYEALDVLVGEMRMVTRSNLEDSMHDCAIFC
ncbi:putative pentatricopeptide repeat-containing protein At3g25970 [Silene latifolia]|uniref:putative pentatricopeptide repeat-containing protein At3g25970 n=1 Tax=Silene latifolia TaxID=37657 RepID=UPI003D77F7D3